MNIVPIRLINFKNIIYNKTISFKGNNVALNQTKSDSVEISKKSQHKAEFEQKINQLKEQYKEIQAHYKELYEQAQNAIALGKTKGFEDIATDNKIIKFEPLNMSSATFLIISEFDKSNPDKLLKTVFTTPDYCDKNGYRILWITETKGDKEDAYTVDYKGELFDYTKGEKNLPDGTKTYEQCISCADNHISSCEYGYKRLPDGTETIEEKIIFDSKGKAKCRKNITQKAKNFID